MTEPDSWWRAAVGPEWSGHSWAALAGAMTATLDGAGPASLLARAQDWADAPTHTLYVRSASLRRAYGFAVAVAQRAAQATAAERGSSRHLIAVGVLDELSVPEDPDPQATAADQVSAAADPRRRDRTAPDTRRQFLDDYARPLERADLTLLRLPPAGDAERVLDQIADQRRNYRRPTVLAGVVGPHEFAATYGAAIAARFGFGRAEAPGQIDPARLTVLDLDRR